jgi:acyl carrier protein
MRAWLATAVLAVAAGAPPCEASPPMTYAETVETVRELAAQEMGRKPADIDTVRSLFKQGLTESQFSALMVAIQDECGVVLRDDEVARLKWNDPASGVSVRQLADLVSRHQQDQ